MDASETLALLDFGTFRVKEDGREIPIVGYVIQTREHRVVLVDTGFPASYLSDPAGAGAGDGLDAFGELVRIGPEHTPRGQLALLGLAPGDVTDVVLTHGDIDHVGALADFAGVPIYVGGAERAMERPRYFADARPLPWPDAEYVPVDDDLEILPGLIALSTPGHSPGHISLLVRLPRTGAIILAGDAISRAAELESHRNGGAWDEHVARHSAERLVRLAARESALLVHGHDPLQWPTLRRAPDVYA